MNLISKSILLFIGCLFSSFIDAQNSTFVKPDKIAIYNYEGKTELAFIRENLVYPEKAWKEGIEGTSFIGFTIGADGVMRDVHVQIPSNPMLDKAALKVVKKMKKNWQPAMKDGKPIESKQVIPITFKINKEEKTNAVEPAKREGKKKEKEKVKAKDTVPIDSIAEKGAVFTYQGKNMQTFIYENLEYPEEALLNGIEGISYIGVTIGADGRMRDASIWKPTNPILDKAALKVVKKMKKWQPAIKDGQPIETKRVSPINFSLSNVRYKVVQRNKFVHSLYEHGHTNFQSGIDYNV